MTALTANYDAERKDGVLVGYKVAAGVVIFKGAMVGLNAAGYAVPAADAADLVFVGVAYDQCNNTSGGAGDKTVRVWKDGSFKFARAAAVQADLGKTAYVVDDNTVALTSSHNVAAGTIVEVPSGDEVRVLIRTAVK